MQKHPAKDLRGFFLARDEHARAGPRETPQPLLHVDAQRERREPREVPDAFADVLVQGNGVAETAAARMRGRSQETIVRRMAAVHVGMRHAAEHGEIVPVRLEHFQIG